MDNLFYINYDKYVFDNFLMGKSLFFLIKIELENCYI